MIERSDFCSDLHSRSDSPGWSVPEANRGSRMAIGICTNIYPCEINGTVSNPPLDASSPSAREIYFGMSAGAGIPPQDQLDLKRGIENALGVVQHLFGDDEAKFRQHYVPLIRLAELGLLGPNAMPEIAKQALEGFASALVQSEGPRIKNGHLLRLAEYALKMSLPLLLAYISLRLTKPSGDLGKALTALSIDPEVLSCFMMLWIGCFVGVVLSYGLRTTAMTITDLIVTDADYLLPPARLLFAGALTMIFGLVLQTHIVDIKIGNLESSKLLGSNPMLAFVIGNFFGISELALPGAVTKKASDILNLK